MRLQKIDTHNLLEVVQLSVHEEQKGFVMFGYGTSGDEEDPKIADRSCYKTLRKCLTQLISEC